MNVKIDAGKIKIGRGVTFGENVVISVKETFSIGNYSHIGSNSRIEGRNVHIGEQFYNSGELRAGVGRKPWPEANLFIGDRCTTHNNFIDLARQVEIGNDVGLSPETTIYNHGYWMSVLDGNPTLYKPVKICDKVIVGYRCTILPGVKIESNVVVGSGSVVTKNLSSGYIYAGNPAKVIRKITPLSFEEKISKIEEILDYYRIVCEYRNLKSRIGFYWPYITVNKCVFDLNTLKLGGDENEATDDFRDFIFRYGIRFYTKRPFRIYEKT